MKLENNVAIITGGAGSIGRATALRLAGEGASVAIADINLEQAQKVADEIRALGGVALALAIDLRNVGEINQMAKTVIDKFGRIDILVTCAGGSARSKLSLLKDAEDEVIDMILDVNLRSVIFAIRAVIGHMIERNKGKIVNVASIVGMQGKSKHADYSAAKAGVIAMTKTLAMELASHNINVNCVSPGLVPRKSSEEVLAHIRKTNYFGRIGKPEDVANLIMFLVSDEADFITGQNYVIDGGRSLGLKGD